MDVQDLVEGREWGGVKRRGAVGLGFLFFPGWFVLVGEEPFGRSLGLSAF